MCTNEEGVSEKKKNAWGDHRSNEGICVSHLLGPSHLTRQFKTFVVVIDDKEVHFGQTIIVYFSF